MAEAIKDVWQSTDESFFNKCTGWTLKQISKMSYFNEFYKSWAESRIKNQIKKYVNAPRYSNPKLPEYIEKYCIRPIPTWANPADDLTLQNYQARVRLVVSWAIANQESKISLATSNASEAALGYTTAGGDMHMGGANPIGGIPKATIKKSLIYFQKQGLIGLKPIPALEAITAQAPTAELRKIETGDIAQTDEDDLGFSYLQSESMERNIITKRNTPSEAFHILLKDQNFPHDWVPLRNIIQQFCYRRWPGAQFKRVMGTISPYVGDNLDPHASIRTTIIGDHFNTSTAILTLEVILKRLGGNDNFKKIFRADFEEVVGIVERSEFLKSQLLSKDCPLLEWTPGQLKESQFVKDVSVEVNKSRTILHR